LKVFTIKKLFYWSGVISDPKASFETSLNILVPIKRSAKYQCIQFSDTWEKGF